MQMLSPAPPPAFQPQLKSDYFFNDDPSIAIAQSPLQLPLSAAPAPSSAARTASAAATPRHAQQQQKVTEPRYYYVGDEDEDEGEKAAAAAATGAAGAAPVTRSIDVRSKEKTASHQQPEADAHLAADWSGGRKSSPPAASHTQPLPARLQHDSSTGSESPSSPIPQPKPVRGSPPASSAATSSSSSPQPAASSSASSSATVPSPVPFRPQSGNDGNVEYVGPFILGRVLGRGCTGTVRLGTHAYTNFEVAFKIIDKRYLNSDVKLWKKVKREIAILKLIEHPHVLKLYDVLETEQRLYLVLEHVRGGELFDYIVSKGRLDRDESLRLTAQIVMGLEHCHQHSICHRDLKPENLLLDDNTGRSGSGQQTGGPGPILKIADFGMAQLMKNNAILKTSCGSPHYASPEIIEGQTYDARVTDVWSIGVILYALITGSLPFDHDNIPTLLSMVTKGHYTTPAHVPSDVSHLISRMLTVDPKKRIRLSEIRRHPCYKGTTHFVAAKSTTWPYSSGDSGEHRRHHKDGKKKRRSILTDDGVHTSSPSGSSDSSGSEDSSSEGEQAVDDSVLTDLEALGLDLNGNRDELVQKIRQRRPAAGQQENIERVFYRLLKKRRNSRLNQLSVLSPKISPRHFQSAAAGSTRLFTRAHSEPDVPYLPLDGDSKQQHTAGGAGSVAPSSRALSAAAQHERIPPPVAGMVEGEWVRSVHGSSSTATTEGHSSSASNASSGSNRIPISPLELDDEREAGDDYGNAYAPPPPPPHRQQSAPSSHTADTHLMPLPAPGGAGGRETSAASYYNRMVAAARSAAPMSSMSVPPSPYRVTTSSIVASAPSSPIFSATPHSMSPGSASAPYATSVMKMSADAYPSNEYIAAEPSVGSAAAGHRHVMAERRGSVPSTSQLPPQVRMRAASATTTAQYAPDGSVARRLFIAEEKQADVDAADALETDDFLPQQQPQHQPYHYPAPAQHARRASADVTGSASSRPSSASKPASPEQSSPEWTTTPRFHRVRFNPSEKSSQTASSALLSGSGVAPVSPVAKRSWFSSIFSRRPSLDLFSKSGKLKKPQSAAPATGPPRAVTGVYSVKPTLTIADEVRRALKAAGIRYVVKKGDSNGASLFECEVGAEEEKEQEDRQQPPLGMRFLTRRKSTTAIDPSSGQQPQLDFRAGNRRASIGSAVLAANMSRTAPVTASADARLPLTASPEQNRRAAGGASAISIVPRHAAPAKGRAKSPDDSLAAPGERDSQSAGSTPRNAAAVAASSLSSSAPNHTRHYSLRSPPLTSTSAGNSRPSSPSKPPSLSAAQSVPVASTAGSSVARRPRANSNDGAVDDTDGAVAGGAAAAAPAVKLIVEITSHHSNDLRCVRFLHVSGDEAVYRQVQNDIQQRLRL